MKKFVKILSLSLVAVMLLAMLASCAPASDPGKAVEALKAEGYTALRPIMLFRPPSNWLATALMWL